MNLHYIQVCWRVVDFDEEEDDEESGSAGEAVLIEPEPLEGMTQSEMQNELNHLLDRAASLNNKRDGLNCIELGGLD